MADSEAFQQSVSASAAEVRGRFRARPIKSAKCKIFKFNLKSTFSPFFGAMSLPHTSKDLKDQIILATGRGILADFWVPHEIDN